MMKTMSNSLGFSTNLIFLATPLLFNQAYASITNTCSILHLLGTQSIYQKYQVSSGPIVNHGTYKGCEKGDTHTGECLDYVFGQTTFAYG
ncbi:MAG: hypothetical protein LPH21_16120, partial [Shewanella sp.]|nr:hypothetical protein [Shewanella sp.]